MLILKNLLENLNKININYKNNIYDELVSGKTNNMSDEEIYDFISKTCANYISREPLYNKIASEYEIKKIYLKTNPNDFIKLINLQLQNGLISNEYYDFINNNINEIKNIIVWERDIDIDFFGLKTLERSYLLKNKNNLLLETPQIMWMRCAIQIHALKPKFIDKELIDKELIEEENIKILELVKETYDLMSNLYFTHATPTLFNSGSNFPQLSSCYLLQCPDDINEIANSFKNIMLISKWAGGIGINLSDIRSNGSLIKSNGGKANGIIPLCRVLESLARYINQSSKRNGSIATYVETWHADIFDFIDLRKNTGDENLRARDLFLGLWVPNAFMNAVENDDYWYLMTPSESIGLTDVYGKQFEELYEKYINEGKYIKKIKAQELYKRILESQMETGMPYILYKDHINEKSNQKNLGTIKNSNLCTEICEYSSPDEIAVCNLASICLPKFVLNNKFDFEELGRIVQIVIVNLNKIININYYPVPETAKSNFNHRPIGLGVQGLADTYAKLGYAFDSEEACKLNKQIFECIYWNSLKKSNELAKKFGPYKSFKGSPFSEGLLQFHLAGKTLDDLDKDLNLDWINLIEDIKNYGTFNSLLTTIMPTASTAQIMNNNESIEPYASNIYVRNTLAGDYTIVNKHLIEDLKNLGLWNELTYNELLFDNGSVQKLDIPIDLKNKYKTAYELRQSVIIKQSIDRGIFIDQSQSMNIFMGTPDFNKLHSAHMYGWKNGIKTGIYYLRSQPVTEAIKFGIDIETINLIKIKRGLNEHDTYLKDIENLNNPINNQKIYKTIIKEDKICENCSA